MFPRLRRIVCYGKEIGLQKEELLSLAISNTDFWIEPLDEPTLIKLLFIVIAASIMIELFINCC
jgi:hypothetical protein